MTASERLARNLRRIRAEFGWSQEDLADRSGLHRTYISGLERGVRNPTLAILVKIAAAVKQTPSELLQ